MPVTDSNALHSLDGTPRERQFVIVWSETFMASASFFMPPTAAAHSSNSVALIMAIY